MAPEPFTSQELVASFFGWLSTACGTWLMIPAWWSVVKSDPAPIEVTTAAYFFFWLLGDGLHLSALLMEGVGIHQWILYVIIAIAEFVILLTLLWKARLYRQAPHETNKFSPVTYAICGFTLLPITPAEKVKPSRKGTVWTNIIGTVVLSIICLGIWTVIAVTRVVDLPPPKAMEWPHSPLGSVAFTFGVLGFFCWTGPRIYVLIKGVDEISTASVVVGFGAHAFNVANIVAINWVPPSAGPIAASMPFVLTSVCCIPLDVLRLYRKRVRERKDIHGSLDDGTMKAILGPAFGWDPRTKKQREPEDLTPRELEAVARAGATERREKHRALMQDLARSEGRGTIEQKEHVRSQIDELEEREARIKSELDSILTRGLRLDRSGGNNQAEYRRLDTEWLELCRREKWDPSAATPSTGSADRKDRLERQQAQFGTVDYQAVQAYRAARHVFGRDDREVLGWKNDLDRRRRERESVIDDIISERNHRHAVEIRPRPPARRRTLSLGHHRRVGSLSSDFSVSSSDYASSSGEEEGWDRKPLAGTSSGRVGRVAGKW